jgi:hypothetical protein
LMKRMMISPVHDLTSTSASQHCCASTPSSRSASAGRPWTEGDVDGAKAVGA